MNGPARLLAFVLGCAAIFTAALGVGHLVGPVAAETAPTGHGSMDGAGGADDMAGMAEGSPSDVVGLVASSGGYTLTLSEPQLAAGRQRLAFTITDSHGDPVTAYDEEHERDLHLVVVRRDLTGFQHLHPALDSDAGQWAADAELTPGAWRVLADFTPSGGEPEVLGADLFVPGDFLPELLPADTRLAHVDGYDVTLARTVGAYRQTVLTATVTEDGSPVTDLEPYLGAYGHLVALRAGDLGYLHVHPEESSEAGPEVAFRTQLPSAGRYRVFFQFQRDGVVHTAAFTLTEEAGHDG